MYHSLSPAPHRPHTTLLNLNWPLRAEHARLITCQSQVPTYRTPLTTQHPRPNTDHPNQPQLTSFQQPVTNSMHPVWPPVSKSHCLRTTIKKIILEARALNAVGNRLEVHAYLRNALSTTYMHREITSIHNSKHIVYEARMVESRCRQFTAKEMRQLTIMVLEVVKWKEKETEILNNNQCRSAISYRRNKRNRKERARVGKMRCNGTTAMQRYGARFRIRQSRQSFTVLALLSPLHK